jgi:hypothetical protein
VPRSFRIPDQLFLHKVRECTLALAGQCIYRDDMSTPAYDDEHLDTAVRRPSVAGSSPARPTCLAMLRVSVLGTSR